MVINKHKHISYLKQYIYVYESEHTISKVGWAMLQEILLYFVGEGTS